MTLGSYSVSEFVYYTQELSDFFAQSQERTAHPHALKINILRGMMEDMTLEACSRILLDVWEARYGAFHEFCRTPSRYGGYEFCFQAHMTAEEVVKDTIWYRAARADPKTHMPRFTAWLATPRVRGCIEKMTDDARQLFVRRAEAFLEAAEASHLKWNARTWTRPRFLLGTLCLEERREAFATKLLDLLGHGDLLDAALGGRQRAQPSDDVDTELLMRLEASHADGSLAAVSACTFACVCSHALLTCLC